MGSILLKLLKKIFGYLLYLFIIWAFFNCIFFLGTHPTKGIDLLFQRVFLFVWNNVSHITLRDFLVFGFFTGVAGFLVYVPNIILLFFFSHLLFESGLTAKAGQLLNPIFKVFGLNGYSFQPLLFGFGCSVNALHCAHDITNKKNRLLTMLIAPFMSCGAKFAVYVLLISVVFQPHMAGSILFILYSIGIVVSLVSALIFQLILKIKREETFEEIADSPLKIPDVLAVFRQTLRDGWIFCKKAGSVIIIASLVIWALSYWPGVTQKEYDTLKQYAQQSGQSIPSRITLSFHTSALAKFGQFIEPAFRPLGQDWKNSVALISSFAGRGIIISSLITMYGIEYTPEGKHILAKALQADKSFSKLSAMALMLFVLLCGSCLASITMFYHEIKSIKLTVLFLCYPIVIAWIVSMLFYQIGRIVF